MIHSRMKLCWGHFSRGMINDPVCSHQKVNIAVAIKMYETEELPEAHGRFAWFVD